MTPWMRKLHRWFGLLIALQFVAWTGSGLVMSLLDDDRVQGQQHRAQDDHAVRAWPAGVLSPAQVLANAGRQVQDIESGWLRHIPVYRLSHRQDVWLVDARTGATAAVDAATAGAIAKADYTGNGRAARPVLLSRPTLEVREHSGPIWRVDFSDEDGTTLYVSAQDGRILERRNDTWRLFDLMWMLHIMDYAGRQDFNNSWVVTLAAGGVWMALSGLWLLVAGFRLSEFVPARWRPRHELAVFAPDGTALRSVEAHAGDSVYVALARNGLQLPSNCGGGQSCGLCEVRFRGHAPDPGGADREHLDEGKLKRGSRLACNLRIDGAMSVEVPGGPALWTEREAVVESVAPVTPFLREIVLRPKSTPGPEFQPGAYIQVHVPAYSMPRHELSHPDHHANEWSALALPETLTSKAPLRRAYSLAMPVEKADGRVVLLARFSPGRQDKKRQPPGRGSTFLYSLKPGDRVLFSGPFGDFAIRSAQAEKVFIGGGAGMAPLRAMIHSRLDHGATERIHFWYGARNLREAPYVDEMAELAKRHPGFSWHLVLSEEAEHGAGLLKGLVHEVTHDVLLRDHPSLHACEFYLCGPPAMLSATRRLLRTLGVADTQVAFDDFKI